MMIFYRGIVAFPIWSLMFLMMIFWRTGNMKEYMLSTVDNPWNPFTNFDEWYEFDISHGYNSLAYLARIAKTDSDMSDSEYAKAVNAAIDDILKYNPLPIYIRVSEDTDMNAIHDDILKTNS